MPQAGFRAAAPFLLGNMLVVATMASGAFVSNGYAGQTTAAERRSTQPATPSQAGPARNVVDRDMDAGVTRHEFLEILKKHPPAVARVLKLDSSLMRNDSYLAAYPTLAAFLERHPEIPLNGDYYLEQVYGVDRNWEPPNPRLRIIEETLAALAAFTAFGIGLGALVWLIKTTLDQRRWSRLSKIQAEVHSKLMDRFSSNDELLTYVQTPSGRRFLESGPSPLQEAPPVPAIGAPFSRILWSVQLGIVLLIAGVGLLFVSTRTVEEAREFFFIFGSLAIALGAGFAVSAGASYFLSRKLGLLNPAATDHA